MNVLDGNLRRMGYVGGNMNYYGRCNLKPTCFYCDVLEGANDVLNGYHSVSILIPINQGGGLNVGDLI